MKRYLLACIALAASVLSENTHAARPNVIVMIADDLGYGDVSCLSRGGVHTPNLDRLAKTGVKFSSGHVTAPLCAPSRAGFFTGVYQQRFGFLDNEGAIPTSLPLIPGVLRDAGYRTALLGKWHSGGPLPHERACFDETLCSARPSPFIEYFNPKLSRNGKVETHQGYITDILAKEAEDFIERNKSNAFALTVSFNAPHIANVVRPFHLIRKEYDAAVAAGGSFDVPKTPTARTGEAQKYAGLFPGDTARADTVATIDALDEAVGRILDKLEQSGLAKDTVIFFFADNGAHPENRSENGVLRDYKWSHFEGGIRVPFLAAYPGVFPAGLEYSNPVSTLDIFPTVAALAGVSAPANLDGVNLTPFLKGESKELPHESLFFHTTTHGAVLQHPWKLVVATDQSVQLFNLAEDIGEKFNLVGAEADRASRLGEEWKKWRAQMPKVAKAQQE
jgi:arylsulfatase A-like enzyme